MTTAKSTIAGVALAAVAALFGLLVSCGDESGPGDHWDWGLPEGVPPPRVPSDNPMTAEKVELGRHLFYDTRLSANGEQSCASCHRQELAFTDAEVTAVGSTGEVHPRNSLSLANVAYNGTLTWANPDLLELEQQIPIPMFGQAPVELGLTGHEEEVLARFRDDPGYQALFAAAFPAQTGPLDFEHITKALAAFVRTLISLDAPFDRLVFDRDETALPEPALRGMALFYSERLGCFHCHGGFNFTQSSVEGASGLDERRFHNTGLYNLDEAGSYPDDNQGIYALTGVPEDMGRFRAPTLRNIELTAPYMHDGALRTLDEVLRFYEAGGRVIESGPLAGDGRSNPHKSPFVSGFILTDTERQDVLAFLRSLTDERFITNPLFGEPL